MTHDEIYEQTKRIEDIIMPKLEYIRDESGNGATIHTVNSMAGLIAGSRNLFKDFQKIGNVEKEKEYIEKYQQRVKDAELWLINLAKSL